MGCIRKKISRHLELSHLIHYYLYIALIKKLNAGNYGHDWKAKVDEKSEFVSLEPCPNEIKVSYQYKDGTFYVFDVYKAKIKSEEMPTPEIEENPPIGPHCKYL